MAPKRSRRSRRSLPRPTPPKTLVDLPDVVKTHICLFLDTSSLLNLRLTSKNLKATVEQPQVLAKIPIKITYSRQLQRVLESRVPFNNFVLSFMSLEEQSYFHRFVSKFGGRIRHLKVKTMDSPLKILTLLANCNSDQLVELEIDKLNVSVINENRDLFQSALDNFKNIRKLTLHNIQEQRCSGIASVQVFLRMLRSCNNLMELKIPEIQAYNDKLEFERYMSQAGKRLIELLNRRVVRVDNVAAPEGWEENWEQQVVDPVRVDPLPEWQPRIERDVLINPVISYVRSRGVGSKRMRRIDVGSLKHFYWPSFKDLLEVCDEKGVKLSNVNSAQLLELRKDIISVNANENLWNVFDSAKITQMHDGFPLLGMENLKELYLVLDPIGVHEGLRNEDRLALPRLESLRLQFMFGRDREKLQLVVRKLLNEVERPTVKKLHVQWFLLETCRTIQAMDLIYNFRSLTELNLDGWDASPVEFNVLWMNLLQLEIISIKNCKNINNRAFVGRYDLSDASNIPERPLNRLKKLHTLIVRDTSGNVTEVSIMESFRWISLRHFDFDSTGELTIDWEMYKELAASPLGKSVEYFSAPHPNPHPYLNEKNVVRRFKNLKRRRLVP